MYKKLKCKALEANLKLKEYGLVLFTWGNASQLDPERRFMAIKPSGVRFEDLTYESMCVLDLADGSVVEGALNPSTDAQTHLEIYRHFSDVYGIVHTHSTYATAYAQAGQGIKCFGTTQADYFYGEIPCTRELSPEEIDGDYEFNTGRLIVKEFQTYARDPLAIPGTLVYGHGPFAWGRDAADAAANAAYLEESAHLAFLTEQIALKQFIYKQCNLDQNGIGHRTLWQHTILQHDIKMLPPEGEEAEDNNQAGDAPEVETIKGFTPVSQKLLDRHYTRKHGSGAYYGQAPAKNRAD